MRPRKKPEPEREYSVSFYSSKAVHCPVCTHEFKREEMHSGRGRLNAGDLTDELRRLYEPSIKYGEVFPLIYYLTVCPRCLYTAFPVDFSIVDSDVARQLFTTVGERTASIQSLFDDVDFESPRGLAEGAASYYLALLCYDQFPQKASPTIKQAICALRGAWVFNDLDQKMPHQHYDYISALFYHKATFLYRYALELEESGKEIIAGLPSFGPDLDKNYGFDGVIYISALLEYKYGSRTDPALREKKLRYNRRALAKMFGLGKASREKPGPLLEHARELYDNFKIELNEDD